MRTERRESLIERRLIRIVAYPAHEDGFLGFGAFFHELFSLDVAECQLGGKSFGAR